MEELKIQFMYCKFKFSICFLIFFLIRYILNEILYFLISNVEFYRFHSLVDLIFPSVEFIQFNGKYFSFFKIQINSPAAERTNIKTGFLLVLANSRLPTSNNATFS